MDVHKGMHVYQSEFIGKVTEMIFDDKIVFFPTVLPLAVFFFYDFVRINTHVIDADET